MRNVGSHVRPATLDMPVLIVNGTPQRVSMRRRAEFAALISDFAAQRFAPAASATP